MYRLAPLTSRLRRRLGLPNDFRVSHSRSWQISPGGTTQVRAALYDPLDLNRISGVFPGNTIAGQIALVQAGERQHGACVAYELRNAVLTRGHLFNHATTHRLALSPLPLLAGRVVRRISEAVLASTHYGIKYFGHWMTDDLPLTLAAQDIGHAVSALTRPTDHQRQYLALLGIEVPVVEAALFDRIVVLDDVGQNAYKRDRLVTLRELVRAQVQPAHHRGVMLLRGTSGERRLLLNESDVAQAMRTRGYVVLDPRQCTAAELARACLDTPIVLGVEGSQLVHGLMVMAPHGTLVELQPPARFNVTFKDRCDVEGMRYAFVVGHGQGEAFSIDIGALNRLLDRIESEQRSAWG
jgi:capsular polysaccharide biosynthesis protein